MNSNTYKTALKPLTSVVIWGGSFIATKFLLEYLEPLLIVLVRQILAVLFLTIIALKQKKSFAINLHDHTYIFILALIAAFHLWIQLNGLKHTTASNTGWIIGITPVFMTMLGIIFFKEKITFTQLIGIFISFVGLILLISKGDISSIDFISNKGDFLILASSFTWSIYSFVNKKISVHYSALMTILYLFLMMSIILLPFTINSKNIDSLFHLSMSGWYALIFLGIFCSGLAYVLWAQAMSEMESSKVGAFLYIEPFVTVFTAWIFLKEEITFLTMFSGIIIIIGVILVNRK
ncbi:MAG: DMT family transporter [Melioribacter sp.]|uniref:DMT family transporter n=1 Tax=Rosettibacter primus TaxID=3111523 RepID=UPI00247DC214|nr:DMT family transporter [Melioribacter sp.]